MSDNNNKPKINVPRFNLTWLYVIIALIFAFLYFSGDEGSATKEVNYTEFQEMVTKGYADKIVAYDNNTVEMYIKPDHIVDVFKKDANKVGRSPSINVQIGSMEALDKFLDEQTKEGNFTGSIQYEKKSDYFSIILSVERSAVCLPYRYLDVCHAPHGWRRRRRRRLKRI